MLIHFSYVPSQLHNAMSPVSSIFIVPTNYYHNLHQRYMLPHINLNQRGIHELWVHAIIAIEENCIHDNLPSKILQDKCVPEDLC